MLVVWPAGAPARFNNVERWLWIPAQGRDHRGDLREFIMTPPSSHARTKPEKIAYQMAGTGKAITYRELDELSNQCAQLFRSLGLKAGDHIAFLMENRLAFMEICWAAQRAGLYYTAISRYLTQDEIAYIVRDCGAKVFITSPKCAEQVRSLVKGEAGEPLFFM